tara:strand:+ start:5909 stop:6103 length:195 start_codon:yes stop_codon:yes gene_type:complete
MSKFNYSAEICEQVDQLDEKLVEVITLLKSLQKRVAYLETIAKQKGLLQNKRIDKQSEESCILM